MDTPGDLLWVTYADSAESWQQVSLAIASLRSFGGDLRYSPVRVFHPEESIPPQGRSLAGIDLQPLCIPDGIRAYWFAGKVSAMARAEMDFKDQFHTLTWIDPSCLILNSPELYMLTGTSQAAFRPVHIQNVGLRRDQALDEYWRRIYQTVGLEDTATTAESFIDGQCLRAYYNTHAFSIDPRLGLMGRWLEAFTRLVMDADFQAACCRDERHRIFLFQALLSALVVKSVPADQVRILPPAYNYPYNLQASIPSDRLAASLDQLVSLTYEGRKMDPALVTDIDIPKPYREFLRLNAC